MKKVVGFMAFSLVSYSSFSQTNEPGETLHSVTERGNQAAKEIVVPKAVSVNGNASDALGEGALIYLYNGGAQGSNYAAGTQLNGAGGLDFWIHNPNVDGWSIPRMRIASNGNIGIGTTSPAYKLDVNGTFRFGNPSHYFVYDGASDLVLRNSDRGSGGRAVVHYMSNVLALNCAGDFSGGTLIGNNVYFPASSGNSYINTGNIGIGTSSPVYKLDVNGGFRSGNDDNYFLYNGYADVVMRTFSRGSGGRAIVHGEGNRLVMNFGGDFGGGTEIGRYIYFSETGSASYINTGNLGIGTSDPGPYKLAVEGVIGARKIKVTQTAWADYVFDSSYQLAPLSHVEKFIQENKHLPEVPSAAEVKKDGVDIGDNQVVLLKKIEELTLYIIQQNKQIVQQNEQLGKQSMDIQQLKKELDAIKTSLPSGSCR